MPEVAAVAVADLAPGFVLGPERYDPGRHLGGAGVPLGDLVAIVSECVQPRSADPARACLVLDTGHAREGVVLADHAPVPAPALGSAKKLARPGDVLISRLRPYLKQVAWVDPALLPPDVELAVSTEFYVLRPCSDASLAFLVPFLLSDAVQAALAAAQEGGHHPRFDRDALAALVVPTAVLDARDETSARVERAIAAIREADRALRTLRMDSPTGGTLDPAKV